MPPKAMRPFGDGVELYVANEAYGSRSGWCEGALVQAENVLHHLGLPRPAWITQDVYQQWVLYNGSGLRAAKMSSARAPFP